MNENVNLYKTKDEAIAAVTELLRSKIRPYEIKCDNYTERFSAIYYSEPLEALASLPKETKVNTEALSQGTPDASVLVRVHYEWELGSETENSNAGNEVA